MKIVVQTITMIILTLLMACRPGNTGNSKDSAVAATTAKDTTAKIDFSKFQLASVKDTSCGMPLSAGLEDTVQLSSKVYGFCSKECKDEFVKQLITENKR